MRKSKKSDNQAWVAWLSDDKPGSTQPRRPVASNNSSDTNPRSVSAELSPKLSSSSKIRLRPQSSMNHRSVSYVDPRAPTTLRRPISTVKPATPGRAIDINITLPKIVLPKLRHFKIAWKQVWRWAGVVILLAVILFSTPYVLRFKAKQAAKTTTSSKPAYAPLEPSAELGNINGAQYDSKRQLYKYNDTYEGAILTISQQPLPDALRKDKSKLKDVAQASIGATLKFETIHGDVYITTDDKTGMQRMVVAHRQLLIFIQSTKSLDNAEWVKYIQTLQ